jgi:inner membrane protein
MKNPCVIPANPTLRFKSGNIKSEAIALFIFTFVLFTFYDLFKNGFWTTYNRSFGTIRHAYREFKESEYIVKVSYEYSFNGNKESGEGYILEASKEMVELWTNNGITKRILKIDSEDLRFKNISIKPSKTNTKYSVKDFKFFNLTIEEINDTLNNKIVSGKILSSNKFIVNQYKVLKNSIELNKEISPKFQWLKNDTLKKVIANKIEVKKAKLYDIQNDNFKEKQKLQLLKNSLNQYKIDLKNASNIYDKNKFEKLIIQVKKKINNFNLNLKNVNYLVQEINILKRELNYNQEHYFTGDLKIFSVPGETSNLIVDNK